MNTGWNFFFSLLLADVAGFVSARLGLEGSTPWVIGFVVFVVFLILFTINSMIHRHRKKQAEKAAQQIEKEHQATAAMTEEMGTNPTEEK